MVFKCCCIFAESTMTNTLKNRNYEKLKKNRQNNKSRIINRNSVYFTFANIDNFKSINNIKHYILIMTNSKKIVLAALQHYQLDLIAKDEFHQLETIEQINKIVNQLIS